MPQQGLEAFLSHLAMSAKAHKPVDMVCALQQQAQLTTGNQAVAASAVLASVVHLLQKEPAVQTYLQAEVDSVLGAKVPTPKDVERMPYLRAVIDEALRLLALKKDMKQSPLGKNLASGVDAWPRAHEFLPQRWLPGHNHLKPSTYAKTGLQSELKLQGYKSALLDTAVILASCAQHFTFSPAMGSRAPQWSDGLVYTPDCVWTRAWLRKTSPLAAAAAAS